VGGAAARAEVKVQEKSQLKFGGFLGGVINVFGGKAAKEGITSTVAVSGNRRLTSSGDTGEIVDLSEEKVYEIDYKKKTYTVTTFDEIRRRMREQEEKAAREAPSGGDSDAGTAPERPAQRTADDPQVEVDFSVKETGARKSVNGFDAREVVATVALREKGKTLEQSGGLVITSDMWLAPVDTGAKELATFERRYFEKLNGPMVAGAEAQMATLMATYPGLREAMGRLQTEGAKMDGTPVLTTTTIEAVKSPQAMAQAEQQQAEQPKGLGGLLGKKLKIGRNTDEGNGARNRSMLMTTTQELLSVSKAVTTADLALPAGFTQK
jgi:hypothetical protein